MAHIMGGTGCAGVQFSSIRYAVVRFCRDAPAVQQGYSRRIPMKRLVPLLLPLASALALAACSPSAPPDQNPATTASAPPAPATTRGAATAGTAARPAPRHAASVPALSKYHWQLSSATASDGKRIDALFANPDKPLQLDFRHGRVNISNTCNGMHGGYAVANGKLKIVGPMTQTMMACTDDKLMAMDKAAGQILQGTDRKSTRLNSSHVAISYAVFCLKKKNKKHTVQTE